MWLCGHLTIFLTYNKERFGLRFHGEERRGARRDGSAARDVAAEGLEAPRERLQLGRVARRRRLRQLLRRLRLLRLSLVLLGVQEH